MKAKSLIDVCIELKNHSVIVETPNGDRFSTGGYIIDSNKNGEPVVVIKPYRKLKDKR